jgi:hypothetical protein
MGPCFRRDDGKIEFMTSPKSLSCTAKPPLARQKSDWKKSPSFRVPDTPHILAKESRLAQLKGPR